MPDIVNLVQDSLSRLPAADGIAVALSGGADSVALSAAIAQAVARERTKRPILLLHCNFHLRGEESDRDASVAAEIAGKLSLPFKSVDFKDVRGEAARTGESIEMICRRLRYNWFGEVISSLPRRTWLALGHHREDSHETLLMNLLRGTGTRGLCGMAGFDATRRIIHPLLQASRREIEDFLAAEGLPWITDSSNLVADVKRNRLRLNVIPAIVRDFPDALRGLDSTADNLADDYKILNQALKNQIREISLDTPGHYDLSRLAAVSASPRRVVFEIVRDYGFNAMQADSIVSAASSTESKQFFSPTHIATVHRGILSIHDAGSLNETNIEADDPQKLAQLSGEFSCKKITVADPLLFIRQLASEKIPFFAMDASADMPSRWVWRTPLPGDRIAPFGMHGRTRLVSDILNDAHASPAQKKQARLLVAGDTPVWLAPWRASGFQPVTRDTREILLFTLDHSCC